MAINIFSGGSSKAANNAPRTSSAAQRAQATTSAISGDAAASNSGSTAVGSSGIGAKVGSLISKVADTASNLPGIPGLIGKGVSLFSKIMSKNDPEWWNTIHGDGLTVNTPLTLAVEGEINAWLRLSDFSGKLGCVKAAFLEFGIVNIQDNKLVQPRPRVFNPDDRMITQYIMPEVRKVANAVVLQSAESYGKVLAGQATMYALWRHLKKLDFFIKQGKTYLPNINVGVFPIFEVKNASWLQSTITRLEEYLHSHVRLPHTLCEYLTWRFGRIHRTNTSAKAGFVFYNVLPLCFQLKESEGDNLSYEYLINSIQDELSSTEELQKATSDLFNAYQDHDQEVLLPEESQCTFDPKEFCLRTNLDILATYRSSISPWEKISESNIIMDSNLDNPTTFMASTVSTENGHRTALFPVIGATIYFNNTYGSSFDQDKPYQLIYGAADLTMKEGSSTPNITLTPVNSVGISRDDTGRIDCGGWYFTDILPYLYNMNGESERTHNGDLIFDSMLCKSMDFYNVGLFMPYLCANANDSQGRTITNLKEVGAKFIALDLTNISIDSGAVPDMTIYNEQILAFANLVYSGHKNRTTYKQIEKRVAKDVANFVEDTTVASLK